MIDKHIQYANVHLSETIYCSRNNCQQIQLYWHYWSRLNNHSRQLQGIQKNTQNSHIN